MPPTLLSFPSLSSTFFSGPGSAVHFTLFPHKTEGGEKTLIIDFLWCQSRQLRTDLYNNWRNSLANGTISTASPCLPSLNHFCSLSLKNLSVVDYFLKAPRKNHSVTKPSQSTFNLANLFLTTFSLAKSRHFEKRNNSTKERELRKCCFPPLFLSERRKKLRYKKRNGQVRKQM